MHIIYVTSLGYFLFLPGHDGRPSVNCYWLKSKFVPLVVDSWGCMHDEFRDLLKFFQEESKRSCFAPASGGLTLPDFLAAFSAQWQLDNARIVFQWQRACRMLTSRS